MMKPTHTKPFIFGTLILFSVCIAAVIFFLPKSTTETSINLIKKTGTGFLSITGAASDTKIETSLTLPDGKTLLIPETSTVDPSLREFDYEGQGNDYTLTTSLIKPNDESQTLSMALHSSPMMIVINLEGFTPEDGLDLYVGKNSISSRTPVDWNGNLKQTIPLPLDPSGPFCLVISGADKKEHLRACHKLPPAKEA